MAEVLGRENELFESLNGVYNELDGRLDSVISESVSSYRVPTVQMVKEADYYS